MLEDSILAAIREAALSRTATRPSKLSEPRYPGTHILEFFFPSSATHRPVENTLQQNLSSNPLDLDSDGHPQGFEDERGTLCPSGVRVDLS